MTIEISLTLTDLLGLCGLALGTIAAIAAHRQKKRQRRIQPVPVPQERIGKRLGDRRKAIASPGKKQDSERE